MKISTCCTAASLLAMLAVPAAGADNTAPKIGQRIDFCGEAGPLMEKGCMGVRSVTNGQRTIYNITTAKPQPAMGDMIQGHGKISADMGICMQGIPLDHVTWKKVAACPASGKAK
ncbi:MAG: hypothetical protein KGR48_01675 [Alphaproteobacteria bacterium]|nr:hypothetical protein [Alphaproteobacteria bacterium]MDE2012686.1 hypothetical protein [Alphaproteobacteria bacterium]MDE2072010.1 hypothetical protein [Alphaproteobacteria bacterium]MDE2350874.1 hypothetical protein [Alphaproteobacteria bacterium]